MGHRNTGEEAVPLPIWQNCMSFSTFKNPLHGINQIWWMNSDLPFPSQQPRWSIKASSPVSSHALQPTSWLYVFWQLQVIYIRKATAFDWAGFQLLDGSFCDGCMTEHLCWFHRLDGCRSLIPPLLVSSGKVPSCSLMLLGVFQNWIFQPFVSNSSFSTAKSPLESCFAIAIDLACNNLEGKKLITSRCSRNVQRNWFY